MDKIVEGVLNQIKEVLDIEATSLKKVKGKKLARFKEIYNLDQVDSDLYMSNSCIFIQDKELFEAIQFTLDADDLVAKVEVTEYNLHLYVIRFLRNYMMLEALDLHEMLS